MRVCVPCRREKNKKTKITRCRGREKEPTTTTKSYRSMSSLTTEAPTDEYEDGGDEENGGGGDYGDEYTDEANNYDPTVKK